MRPEPTERWPLLRGLTGPDDLAGLSIHELRQLCRELREVIIETVSVTGGHLGSSLGAVELAVAIHRLLRSPVDRVVWDTGHQAYAHKLLTGRLDSFATLRQLGGVGGFPRRSESRHDVMDGGHAGTGLSIAEGLALARDRRGSGERICVVVGDAALMTGMSLEALNDIGQRRTRLLIVLNDNEMSISPTVGAVSQYLSRIKLSDTWRGSKRAYDDAVERIPLIGPTLLEWSRRLRHAVVDFSQPGRLFEDLGITYVGPVPGHDLEALDATLRPALTDASPIIVHVRTRKGAGYRPAETDQVAFHGASLPPMPGRAEDGPREDGPRQGRRRTPSPADRPPSDGDASPSAEQRAAAAVTRPTFTAVMVRELIHIARTDPRVVAITAGMPTGTGLSRFGEAFPGRMYDVGIAEQHAMTLAAGLALAGSRPLVALYSTFLQRAFDQVIHDVCQNDLPVVVGIDRAGLVGEDGTSHQGMFTLSALRQAPNLVLAAPRDEQQLRRLLRTAFGQTHPFAIQYPRDAGFGLADLEPMPIEVGSGELLREGTDILLVGLGPIVIRGLEAAEALRDDGWSVGVIDARFAVPLPAGLIVEHARAASLVVTLEESELAGGFGSAVLEALGEAGLTDAALRAVPVERIGIPAGRFIDHGAVADLRRVIGLDTPGIRARIVEAAVRAGIRPRADDRRAEPVGRPAVARPA
jgi:1-deoxy-D-xylulose-5-phosphate synthase